jgi:hypothetical protein
LSDEAEVLSGGQVLVDGRILPREADGGWDLFSVADDVESEHPRLAAVRFEHRRQDPNSGGLPGAVRPEQAQHSVGLVKWTTTSSETFSLTTIFAIAILLR